MRVCFICAEYAPYAKTGGLGDVAAALTAELTRAGHEVLSFIPLHGQINLRGAHVEPVEALQRLTLAIGSARVRLRREVRATPGRSGSRSSD